MLSLHVNHPLTEQLTSALQDELDTSPFQPTCDIGMFSYIDNCPSQLFQLAKLLKPFGKFGKMEQIRHSWSPPWISTNIKTTISSHTKEKAKKEHLKLLTRISPEACIVYTDGSLSNKRCSSIGFVLSLPITRELKCYSFNLGDKMGITDTETYCILKAILTVKRLRISGEVYIFSDSQASLSRIKHAPNQICHQLRAAAQNLTLHLLWCPGHMGIEGNEMADNLAREGQKMTALRKDKFTTLSFLRELLREKTLETWRQIWDQELFREEEGRKARGLGKYYRLMAHRNQPNFQLKPFQYNKYSRRTQSEYIQARTGIGNTLTHLKKIGKVDNDWCNHCGIARQTIPHLILHCCKFKGERKKEFGGLEPLSLPMLFGTQKGKTALLYFLWSTKCLGGRNR